MTAFTSVWPRRNSCPSHEEVLGFPSWMSPAYQGVIGPDGFVSRSGNRNVMTVADRGVDASGRRFNLYNRETTSLAAMLGHRSDSAVRKERHHRPPLPHTRVNSCRYLH